MRKTNSDTHWVNNLRSYTTIMVIIAHSCFAYMIISKKVENGIYTDSFFVIADMNKWVGADLIFIFLYNFLMPLMFLIGGLFLKKSLTEKGVHKFSRNRIRRLLYPFILLGIPMNVIGYYAGYIFSYNDINFTEHVINFITIQNIPAGPSWFLTVILCFSLFYAITYTYFKNIYTSILHFFLSKYTLILVSLLIVISILLYSSITYKTGMHKWFGFGFFDFQVNRIFDYFLYFLIGVFLGETNFIFTNKKSEKWKKWIFPAVVSYLLLVFSFETKLENNFSINVFKPSNYTLILFPIASGLMVISHLFFFKKRMNFTNKILDSLQENAYSIYISHIVFLLWIQYVLLSIDIHAILKIGVSIIGTLILSWLFGIGIRKYFQFFKEIL